MSNSLLTNREKEIVRLLAEGQSNAEIARTLSISINTVKNHMHSIYRKSGTSNRVKLALRQRVTRGAQLDSPR